MKRLCIAFVLLGLLRPSTQGQTNTFPDSGSAGIGTTAPASPLQVHNSSGAGASSISLTNADSGAAAADGLLLQLDGWEDAYILQRENRPLYLGTNDQPRLTITADGKVGIGTTAPVRRFELNEAGNAILAIRQPDAPNAGKYAQITLSHGSTYFGASDRSWQIVSNGMSSGEADLVLQYWGGDFAERARLTSSGNFAVGTNNPQGTLDLGSGTHGRSLVWGGPTGANHYASVGASYSSAALSLVHGLELDAALRSQFTP